MGKTSVLRKLAKDLEDVALPDDSPINDLAQIDIGPLREPEATTLIERLLLGIGAEPDQALITRIFVETSGIPFYAQAVIDQLRYEPPGVDITHLVDRMIVENTWHTDHYVTRIEEYYGKADEPLVLAVLDAIATSDAVLSPDELLRRIPTERPPSRDKLLRLLPMLEKDHYLTRVGVGDRFSSDLLGEDLATASAAGMTVRPFTPSQESAADLEARTVGRDALLAVLTERLRVAATSDTRPHTLLVGPRGSGKSHLLEVVLARAARDPELASLAFAKIPEDVIGITRYADLVWEVANSLGLAPRRGMSEVELEALVLAGIDDRTLVIVVENLDRVFRSIGLSGQQNLRSWVEASGRILLFTATPALFADVKDRKQPWFGGLITTPVDGLSAADGRELLTRLARADDDTALVALLESDRGRARVEAVSRLTAGSPRIWMVLSGVLTAPRLDELVPAVEALVEGLVPYYQSLLWDLPDNQQAIVRQLAEGPIAARTSRQIAAETGLTEQTVSKALSLLQEGRWVRSEKVPGGDQRETWYSLREPMLRHHFQWRSTGGEPLRLIVEILRSWHTSHELRRHLAAAPPLSLHENYLTEALAPEPTTYDHPYTDADPATLLASARGWMKGVDLTYSPSCGVIVEACVLLAEDPSTDAEAIAAARMQDPPLGVVQRVAEAAPAGLKVLLSKAVDSSSGDDEASLRLVLAGFLGRDDPARAAETVRPDVAIDASARLKLEVALEHSFWRGMTGDPQGALRELSPLVSRIQEHVGADSDLAQTARSNLASWTGVTGDASTALTLYHNLLIDRTRILGPDHPNTLATRAQVAYYTGETGDATTALTLYQNLVTDSDRILKPDHGLTMSARAGREHYEAVCAQQKLDSQGLTPLLQRALDGDAKARVQLPAELKHLVNDERERGSKGDAQ